MDNQSYEQEIDLKDLMFAVFHKWRGIILTAVILGILFGGYKLAVGLTNREDAETVKKAQEDYNESLEIYETTQRLYQLDIESLGVQIQSQEEYLFNSVLMRLNPFHKNIASADIFVKADYNTASTEGQPLIFDPVDPILSAYNSLIQNQKIQRVEGVGAEGLYLNELVTTQVNYEANVISIKTTYTDEEGAMALLTALLQYVQDEASSIQQELEDHEIVIMNQVSTVSTDDGLLDSQQRASGMIASLQKTYTDKKSALENLKAPTPPSALSITASLKSGIKYGILGGVLGAFLSVFCICVVFLMGDKLKSEKELKDRFGLKILGAFEQVTKKRAFAGVDRWLDRLEGKTSKKPAEVYEIMAANVRNYMEADRNIMILSSTTAEKTVEIAEELKKRLNGEEIHIGTGMGTSAETLRLLPEAGQIILVEERSVSKYGDIQNELDVIRSLDKYVIGCIVI